jgi:catechol-2,3-dioxygenase
MQLRMGEKRSKIDKITPRCRGFATGKGKALSLGQVYASFMNFTQLKEMHIQVKNLRKTLSFYQDTLGFMTLSYQKEKHAIFKVGRTVLVAHLVKGNEQEGPASEYPNSHLVLESSKGEYESNKEDLIYDEIEILEETTRESGHRAFFINDPDGNLVEITEYGIWEN